MNEYLVHYMDKDEQKVRVFYFLIRYVAPMGILALVAASILL